MKWQLQAGLVCLAAVIIFTNVSPAQSAPPAGGSSLSPDLMVTFSLGQQEGNSSFYLNARRPIADYRSFMLDSPPRFVLELANCDVRSPGVLPGGHLAVNRVRIGRSPGKIRFVFDLSAELLATPEVVREAGGLKVVFRNSPSLPLMPDRQFNFSFYRQNIRDFFEYVDALCDFTIRIAPDVDGLLTMSFKNMAIGEAVRLLLDTYGLEMVRVKDDVYLVRRHLTKT